MARGWNTVSTNSNETKTFSERKRASVRQAKLVNRMLAKTPSLSYEKLQEESENSYKVKIAEDASLLQAFNDKKLKSKALINRAKALKKASKDEKVPTAV